MQPIIERDIYPGRNGSGSGIREPRWNYGPECKICGFDSGSRRNISHFRQPPHKTGSCDEDPLQAICCMVVEPTLCMYYASTLPVHI